MRKAVLAVVFASIMCLVPGLSQAALLLAIDTNGVQACASDNNVGCTFGTTILDVNASVNTMAFGGDPVIVGGLSVLGSAQTATFGPPYNILNTSSFQVTNTSAVTQTGAIAVSQTGFTAPVDFTAASGSGTLELAVGSSITMEWWADAANGQGALTSTTRPGVLVHTCTITATTLAQAIACDSGPVAVSFANPFSMTLYTAFSLTPGGTLVGRSQTEVSEVTVPEPALMALVGMGLLGAGFSRRRRV